MKRRTSEFIPYRRINGQWYLFVQKRTADAPFAPDMFGIFGGGIDDGESPDAALFREVREELDYSPRDVHFFRKYDFEEYEINVFVSEVGENFESEITVLEGEYGKFLSEPELKAQKVLAVDWVVLNDLFRWLNSGPGNL